MGNIFHSVTLDKAKCLGCTNCIKRCPTEAIRVRNGKAVIIAERCIDCGECIRICPRHAKRAKPDPFNMINDWEYKIALPAPSIFGQFNNLNDINVVLTGLKNLGFNSVFEVSRGAELVSRATKMLMEEGVLKTPVISSACPVIVRLIKLRFPNLCKNVLPLNSPVEIAARIAKDEAATKTGLPIEKIGAFFITPCPAKVTEIKVPIGLEESHVNGAISISEIFPKLISSMERIENIEKLANSGSVGVRWAATGGEAGALANDKYLAADGIENVIRVLDELEDERIQGLDFLELNACSGGCVGGVLNVENAYIAKARIHLLKKHLPVSKNYLTGDILGDIIWDSELKFDPVLKLSDNVEEAMRMLEGIETVCKDLPGLDCGSCGAPSCRALAEDIIKGDCKKDNCIFVLNKEK